MMKTSGLLPARAVETCILVENLLLSRLLVSELDLGWSWSVRGRRGSRLESLAPVDA